MAGAEPAPPPPAPRSFWGCSLLTPQPPPLHFPTSRLPKGVAPCVRRCLKERGARSNAATHTQTPPGKAKPRPQTAPTVLGSDALVPCSRRTRKQLTELERADVKPHTGSASVGRAARCQGMLTASSPCVSPAGPPVSPPGPPVSPPNPRPRISASSAPVPGRGEYLRAGLGDSSRLVKTGDVEVSLSRWLLHSPTGFSL